ncbi:M60 family metallopeptidase [Pedobacter sp. ISL-68]|uniref:M60 family metallopeptidase n=1 Tax=unclassified Pedobacter TaxID=2628915 RepID=UPI001BE8FE2D|nr:MULTISPECIES: M60 family metallopeptidase [unclassified Pedobacter]MBT2564177.1 M60 family metallopeptidase [Pedobacter sp. ISL-64]MBT2589688.1 M60 family metallopeptidase [Pedobacter sp. ISL-68]
MKLNHFTISCAVTLLLGVTACKKYGYNIPDGYPDDSQNVAAGNIDTNMKVIDKSMYAKARVFPGLVDQSEPRVQNAKFTLDLNFTDQTADNLRISIAPEPQYSTGYYAAPGELVKIEVPTGIEGLTVQVGGHTDNLAGKSPLLRDPVVYMRQQLYAGANYVRNLYGGTIYIRAGRAYPNPVEFTITNACVSPDFILGQTVDADWVNKVKASQVPWLELRSKRVIFLVPRDKIVATFSSSEPYTNPTVAFGKWNDVFDLDYNAWMGLSDNAADVKDRSPQGPWRGVLDIQLSAGYGHSGFPFVGLNDSEWFKGFTSLTNITTSNGMWGSYHEFGHNCQQGKVWSWSTLGETTNNLFSFKVANRIGANYNILHPSVSSGFPQAIAYASGAGVKNFDTDVAMNDPFKRMTPFVQIFEKYGYGAMTYLYSEARHAPRLNTSDITMHNFVYEKLSDYTQIDLGPFFDAWGILTSPTVRDKVAAKYPQLNTQIWTYNPLNKTGGTAAIVPVIVSVSSNQSNEGAPANMLDGNNTTYWHSQYSPAPTAAQTYPFTIVMSQGNRASAKGMYFFPRNSTAQRPKDIEVFVSNDNVTYTSVGTTQIPNAFARYDFLFPAGAVNAQYFRVILKNSWTANNTLASLSEIGVIK